MPTKNGTVILKVDSLTLSSDWSRRRVSLSPVSANGVEGLFLALPLGMLGDEPNIVTIDELRLLIQGAEIGLKFYEEELVVAAKQLDPEPQQVESMEGIARRGN